MIALIAVFRSAANIIRSFEAELSFYGQVFGFTETVWTSQAVRTLATESGAIAALGCALTLQHRHARPQPHPIRVR